MAQWTETEKPKWTFLTNHALVLAYLSRHPRITAVDLCRAVGITERGVRKIIADLHEAGYISKTREGRRVRYRVNPDLTLRHHAMQDVAIGSFLEALGWHLPSSHGEDEDAAADRA